MQPSWQFPQVVPYDLKECLMPNSIPFLVYQLEAQRVENTCGDEGAHRTERHT